MFALKIAVALLAIAGSIGVLIRAVEWNRRKAPRGRMDSPPAADPAKDVNLWIDCYRKAGYELTPAQRRDIHTILSDQEILLGQISAGAKPMEPSEPSWSDAIHTGPVADIESWGEHYRANTGLGWNTLGRLWDKRLEERVRKMDSALDFFLGRNLFDIGILDPIPVFEMVPMGQIPTWSPPRLAIEHWKRSLWGWGKRWRRVIPKVLGYQAGDTFSGTIPPRPAMRRRVK